MIPDTKFREMAEALLAKSRSGQVRWEELPAPSQDDNKESYIVRLRESRIVLRYYSPEAEPDWISLEFLSVNGNKVARWSVREDELGWETLHALFWEAKRFVTHWDKVLDEVSNFLGVKAEPIGAPSK